jgi:hypothetical protein
VLNHFHLEKVCVGIRTNWESYLEGDEEMVAYTFGKSPSCKQGTCDDGNGGAPKCTGPATMGPLMTHYQTMHETTPAEALSLGKRNAPSTVCHSTEWQADRQKCAKMRDQVQANADAGIMAPYSDTRHTLLLVGPLYNIGHMFWDVLSAILPLVSEWHATGGGADGASPRLTFDGARKIEAVYAPFDPTMKRIPWLADMLMAFGIGAGSGEENGAVSGTGEGGQGPPAAFLPMGSLACFHSVIVPNFGWNRASEHFLGEGPGTESGE